MKITAIDTALLAVPTPRPMALQYPEHKLVVAQILTDQGLRGLGYSLVFNGGGAEAVAAYLETRLKPALLGEDPTHVERLWEKMFRADMGVRMMVDVNQIRDVLGNVRQAAALEEFDLVWYEEPVLADDYAGMAEVARRIRIPVAAGENHYTRWEFKELLERRAIAYAMPDVCRANGFSETLRIARLAAAHGVPVTPHLIHEISIHVVGACTNGFLVEYMDWAPPDLFEELPACKDGLLRIPDRPGHGISLARGAIEKYGK